jgi:hypothetical protein
VDDLGGEQAPRQIGADDDVMGDWVGLPRGLAVNRS